MGMDGYSAARSMLLSISFVACASGLAGCLKTETPVVTEQTADHPFKQHLLVRTYERAGSRPTGYVLLDLDGGKYRWTELALGMSHGNPGRHWVYLKALPSGGYILASGPYIGGFLRRDQVGFWYVYTDLDSADCERLGQSEFNRLKLQKSGLECVAPTFDSLVSVLEKIDWTHRAPNIVFKIIRESDDPVIDSEPALVDIKNRCAATIGEDKVKHIIAEHQGVAQDAITPQSRWSDLNADDMDLVELTMAFENAFDLEIPDDDAERMTTVQSAIDIMREICLRTTPQ